MATVKISELPNTQNVGYLNAAATGQILAGNCAEALPSYSFKGDPDTGFWPLAGNWIGVSCGGGTNLAINASGHALGQTAVVQWYNANRPDGGSSDTGIRRYAAGVQADTDGSTGIRGLRGGGAAVASAAALPLPTGSVFHVTGTTNVTSITSTNFAAGAQITLIFDGILTFTNGGNLKLSANFVTSALDTITLVFDGTNWFEMCRSANV